MGAGKMRIPVSELSVEALDSVIESFVLREGTDYGTCEQLLTSKCAQVRRQIDCGEAWIDFDPDTETIDIRLAS